MISAANAFPQLINNPNGGFLLNANNGQLNGGFQNPQFGVNGFVKPSSEFKKIDAIGLGANANVWKSPNNQHTIGVGADINHNLQVPNTNWQGNLKYTWRFR